MGSSLPPQSRVVPLPVRCPPMGRGRFSELSVMPGHPATTLCGPLSPLNEAQTPGSPGHTGLFLPPLPLRDLPSGAWDWAGAGAALDWGFT